MYEICVWSLFVIIQSTNGGITMNKYVYTLLVVCLLSFAVVGCASPADKPDAGEYGVTQVKQASPNAVI